jgi:hypothetical protein
MSSTETATLVACQHYHPQMLSNGYWWQKTNKSVDEGKVCQFSRLGK